MRRHGHDYYETTCDPCQHAVAKEREVGVPGFHGSTEDPDEWHDWDGEDHRIAGAAPNSIEARRRSGLYSWCPDCMRDMIRKGRPRCGACAARLVANSTHECQGADCARPRDEKIDRCPECIERECASGHARTDENTSVRRSGAYCCKTCDVVRNRGARARRRGA